MEKIKKILLIDIEKILLNNLTRVSFYLILILIIIQIIFNFIELGTFITIIGAIFAFWYGYKKYERDKELEIIEKYTEKYNKINNDLFVLKNNINKNKQEIKRKYESLFNLFYEEFYLNSKGFISKELWNEWKDWIELDLYEFLNFSIYKLYNLEDSDIFIGDIITIYSQYHGDGNNKARFEGLSYLEFIIKVYKKIKQDIDYELKNKNFDINHEKLKDLTLWISIIIESTEKTIIKSATTKN